jgi:hypothetical protein
MTYDTDLLEWSDHQAQLLREGRFEELDLENLIEEVKELGKSEFKTCYSYVKLIMIHLLYLNYWEAEKEYNQKHWEREIDNFRVLLESIITPSIKNKLIEQWEDLYLDASKRFEQKTKLKAPQFCPYFLDDIL